MATTLKQVRRTMVIGVSAFSLAVVSALPAAANSGNESETEQDSKSSQSSVVSNYGEAYSNTGGNTAIGNKSAFSVASLGLAVVKTGDSSAVGNYSYTEVNQEQKTEQKAETNTITKHRSWGWWR